MQEYQDTFQVIDKIKSETPMSNEPAKSKDEY